MLFKHTQDSLEPLEFYDISQFEGKEKDLENLLAKNLSDLYAEGGQLMPIFQERQGQEEPDLCALDKNGNLIVFELKRGYVPGDTTIQVMRYVQSYGQKRYSELNEMFRGYTGSIPDLKAIHAETFGLDEPLKEDSFNTKQRLVIIGGYADYALIRAVDYWKDKGIDIDYIPYRFYKIANETYFEFFAKPYDYHLNPRDIKGVIFDTNRSYDENSVWDMFHHHKISAYGSSSRVVKCFHKGDYAFYYHKGYGIIGAGIIKDSRYKTIPDQEEMFRDVELITPQIQAEEEIRCITPSELSELLGKSFFYASTVKKPYLTIDESKVLVEALQKKYRESLV